MMKKLGIILISLLLCNFNFAESNKKATEILDAVIEKTEAQKTMEVKFTLSMINEAEGINESKSGVIQIMGNSYRLNVDGMIVISDGHTSWNLLPDDEEVMINTIEEDDDSITPQNLLNEYQKNYKSRHIKEYQKDNITYEMILLVPLKGKKFNKIEVVVDKRQSLVKSFSIYNKDGNIYLYEIIDYQLNKDIPVKNFTFNEDDYPDYEVIDMR